MAIENNAAAAAAAPAEENTSLFSSFVSFFVPTAHAEAPEESEPEPAEEAEEEPAEEEEEEEEPEDPAPAIREECEQKSCADHVHHFKHCTERVEEGKGFPGEDCVEEFFHVLHCVDQCSAAQIFRKLN